MENFEEFAVHPDDENDQVKVSWKPTAQAEIKFYYLEKSSDNKKFVVWKKIKGLTEGGFSNKLFEVDFDPYSGWSYYRIKEITSDGKSNYTPSIPVFIGLEHLKKGMRIIPETLVKDTRQKVSLSDFDKKSFILVLRDQNGDEFLYDKPIRASNTGLFIEAGSGIPAGTYTITASSLERLTGMTIIVN